MKTLLKKTWTKSERSPQWHKASEVVDKWNYKTGVEELVPALMLDDLIALIEEALYAETHR